MNEKLFSIVTVTWNAATVIGPTLQSVREQTCMDYEYLVIDGASSDNTLQLVRDADIAGTRIYSEPDRGLYDAMNKASTRATALHRPPHWLAWRPVPKGILESSMGRLNWSMAQARLWACATSQLLRC